MGIKHDEAVYFSKCLKRVSCEVVMFVNLANDPVLKGL